MAGKQLGIVGLAVMVVVFAAAAHAVGLTLTNPSFESDPVANGAMSATYAGWTQYGSTGSAVTWNPTSASFSSADEDGGLSSPAAGAQCLWVTGGPDLYQVYSYLSYIEADKVYTLTAAIGAPLDQDFGHYGIVLASPNGDIASNWDSTDIVNRSGLFYDESTSFNTGSGGRADLVGKMLIVNLSGDRAAIDNVRLSVTAIPEPGGVMLLSTGAIVGVFVGLLVCVWRIWYRTSCIGKAKRGAL